MASIFMGSAIVTSKGSLSRSGSSQYVVGFVNRPTSSQTIEISLDFSATIALFFRARVNKPLAPAVAIAGAGTQELESVSLGHSYGFIYTSLSTDGRALRIAYQVDNNNILEELAGAVAYIAFGS